MKKRFFAFSLTLALALGSTSVFAKADKQQDLETIKMDTSAVYARSSYDPNPPASWDVDRKTHIVQGAPSGLNVRYSPEGRIIGSLRNGTRVTHLKSAYDRYNTIWYLVSTPEITGWVFSAYVRN
ncbi:SH3 domain-containing protein [Clostridium botulinum]|uniref:SH3 domain-containing protein n=1 Tax=Clostridium botulinum TaxID=1491 RepID=UPI001C9AEB60|nr:SH3 domain-containing protein [Clostridium botulinum]MBY6842881.1 SH3 domain-containing protein [Clostridium botulinum]